MATDREIQYPARLVAAMKGLMIGCRVSARGAAELTGLPYLTLRDWKYGRRCAKVRPDGELVREIVALIDKRR